MIPQAHFPSTITTFCHLTSLLGYISVYHGGLGSSYIPITSFLLGSVYLYHTIPYHIGILYLVYMINMIR